MKQLLPQAVSDAFLVVKKAVLKSPGTYLAFALLLGSITLTTIVAQQQQDVRQRAQTVTTFTPKSVQIVDFSFSPGTTTVTAGSTVTWTNKSTNGVPHTTTSDIQGSSNSWDSGTLNPGASFTKTFTQTGTFDYHCEIHGKAVMAGKITVVAATQPTPTRTPTVTPTRTPTPTLLPGVPTSTPGVPTPTIRIPTGIQPTITKPIGGVEDPPYVCLGSCPTNTPTPKPTEYPSITPTKAPTPTPTFSYKPTATPYIPGPTTSLEPCSNEDASIASDNGKSDNTKKKSKSTAQNPFTKFLDFFWNLIMKLIEILFGVRNTPPPAATPTPTPTRAVYPPTVIPTAVYPTNTPPPVGYPTATVTPEPYATITPTPIEYGPTPPCDPPTPTYKAPAPTNTPVYPSATYTPSIATPTLISYISPTLGAILSPTLGAITPTVQPSVSANPTPYGRSVASIVYVPGNEPLKTYDLTATEIGNKMYFNGMSPGPQIRANQGDHLRINVHNLLQEPLSVHWHGIKLPSSQDGVPGVTQNAIKAGDTMTYDYVVPDAGTYWYHSHQNGIQQVSKGLLGSLVVDPKQETIKYDRDYYIVYRNTDPITQQFDANPGDKVHVRILNSRFGDFAGTPLRLAPVGVPYKIVALDGQDINGPQEIAAASKLLEVGFAQRYDLSFTMPASGGAMIADGENMQTIQFGSGVTVPPDGLGSLPVFDFTSYGTPGPDTYLPRLAADQQETLTIGPNLSINGKLGHEIPDLVMKENKVVYVRYENNSNMSHPMHLHGHFYSVIKKNDKPLTGSPIHLDTILLHPGETADLAFYTDDPGVWMLHCHILDHAAAGLSMITRYDDVYTPYSVPGDAGNNPH